MTFLTQVSAGWASSSDVSDGVFSGWRRCFSWSCVQARLEHGLLAILYCSCWPLPQSNTSQSEMLSSFDYVNGSWAIWPSRPWLHHTPPMSMHLCTGGFIIIRTLSGITWQRWVNLATLPRSSRGLARITEMMGEYNPTRTLCSSRDPQLVLCKTRLMWENIAVWNALPLPPEDCQESAKWQYYLELSGARLALTNTTFKK